MRTATKARSATVPAADAAVRGHEQVLPLGGILPTDATLVFDAYAPFLLHLGSSFFVGGGPRLELGIGDDVGVVFGVFSTIGGHF